MSQLKDGCVKPARGPILVVPSAAVSDHDQPQFMEKNNMLAKVGKEAIDFEANAFIEGEGFKTALYKDFQALNVEVLSVSTDSRFVHKMWQEKELSKMLDGGVPFPMLSDGGGKIGSIYGVYDDDAGVDIRGRFIIDPDFVIRAMEVLTPEVGRNPNELLRQIKAFQLVRETGTPGPALVGKVWEVWKP
jgi:peroxiredoxin (alkyl hydroperoxide reductase subunit C)